MPAKQGTRKSWGPPRKAENRTGSGPAFAAAIARALPGTETKNTRGGPSFSLGGQGQVFLALDPDDHATVWTGPDEERSFVLGQLPRDEVRALIEDAWAAHAPKRSVTAYRKKRAAWAALPAITEDDIRRLIAGFPGANEGPIWGNEPGFRVGDEKKTRFARFGPPVSGRIGNLLPPDDEHAIVIFRCEQKPALLASAADRFFTTPHYGPADEPGGIIVRLPELRGQDDLAEMAELLEDAWRAVAPPDLIAQLGS